MHIETLLTPPHPHTGTDPTVPLPKASVPTYIIIIGTIGSLIVVIVTAISIAGLYKCHGKFKITRRRSGTGQPGIGNRIFDGNTDWQLYERIGHGRYGMVYRGNYQNEIVAIKITSSRSSWENERNLYAMESTSHQNVLRYIATESRGSGYQSELFMITEYYPLGSLCVYLRNHRVSWEQACCMVRSLAKGLAHLHSEWYTNSAGILAEKYAVAHRCVCVCVCMAFLSCTCMCVSMYMCLHSVLTHANPITTLTPSPSSHMLTP